MKKNEYKYNVQMNFPKEGVRFIDFMPLFMDYKAMNKVTEAMLEFVPDDTEVIIAPESRGFILGTFIASKRKINLVPIRKHGKIPPDFVGASTKYETEYSVETLDIPKVDIKDKKCCFIDDVYATGGTYKACKELAEDLGGVMQRGVCLLDVGIIPKENEIVCMLEKEDVEGD